MSRGYHRPHTRRARNPYPAMPVSLSAVKGDLKAAIRHNKVVQARVTRGKVVTIGRYPTAVPGMGYRYAVIDYTSVPSGEGREFRKLDDAIEHFLLRVGRKAAGRAVARVNPRRGRGGRRRQTLRIPPYRPGSLRRRRNGDVHELDADLDPKRRKNNRRSGRRANRSDVIGRKDYPAIFGDYDGDKIPDVDDPHPYKSGDTHTVEEVKLSDEIAALIKERRRYVKVKSDVMRRLRSLGQRGAKVQGRVKTPYSIINKLRRKRLGTLTDIAGTRIVLPDRHTLEAIAGAIRTGRAGRVVETVDYYRRPLDGYRAYHFIVMVRTDGGELPVEIQVKTTRMKRLSKVSHTAYKRGRLNVDALKRLSELADAADRGDKAAAKAFSAFSDRDLQKLLTKR